MEGIELEIIRVLEAGHAGKIRNPNIEIRNKFQKRESRKMGRVSRLRFSAFPFLRICFGFRISIFGFSHLKIEELTGDGAVGDRVTLRSGLPPKPGLQREVANRVRAGVA